MVYRLSGKIIEKKQSFIAIDIGKIALEVTISLHTYSSVGSIGDEVTLYTNLISREDSMTLYGFISLEEKEVFLHLITVSGIGPKAAIKILGGVGIDNLRSAIASKDSDMLVSIPGIGKKTADRIIVELTDKFSELSSSLGVLDSNLSSNSQDVVAALVNLGYKQIDARKAIDGLKDDDGFELILRGALKRLTGRK